MSNNLASFDDLRAATRALPAPTRPVAMILGSGMTPVTNRIKARVAVAFGDIPGMVAPSVAGHGGQLVLGDWAGRPVLVFLGRLHCYEGHSWDRVVGPVKIAAELGAKVLLLTNAAGGIGERQDAGTLMAITDHIEWTRPYCWRHAGPGGLGDARPSPYSLQLVETLQASAAERNLTLHRGVYAMVTGPSYETPAEIRAMKAWGADAAGMSTAREAQCAFDLGMECAAVSCITNRAAGLSATPLNHKEVLEMVAAQAERLADLLQGFVLNVTGG